MFIVGLPAIYSTQPRIGRWGIIGLILMAIPSLTNIGWLYGYFDPFSILGVLLALPYFAFSIFPPQLLLYLGYLIVGWLTTQALVFPKWVGWLFLSTSILNIATFFGVWPNLPEGPLTLSVYAIITLMEAAALVGYGWHIEKHQRAL